MPNLAAQVVADRDRVAVHKSVDMEKGMCDHKDLGVGVGADARDATGNWRKTLDTKPWKLEVAEQDHNGQSESCQGLLVVGQVVSVVKRRMDSGERDCVRLILHDKVVEDFPGMARDGKLVSHCGAYQGPSVMFGRTIHDDMKDVHVHQPPPAIQQKDVVDRNQERPRAYQDDHCHPSGMKTSEAYPWYSSCHVLLPYGRAVPLSCATCHVDLFGVMIHRLPLVAASLLAVGRLAAAMTLALDALVMVVQWLKG